MNINILMIALGVTVLASCSTAYRSGQTPDDVYYSAPKEVIATGDEEYLAVDNGRERYSPNRRQDNSNYNYDDYETYRNDRWLRMSIGRPYYLNTFNNYYWNDWGYSGMYGMGFNHGFNNLYGGWGLGLGIGYNSWYNPWGSSMYWNSFYNPYAFNYNPYGYGYGHMGGVISNAKPPVYRSTARPSVFNARAYSNNSSRSNVNSSRSYYNPRTGTYSNYSNSNTGARVANGSGNTRRSTSSDRGTYYNTNSNSRDTYTPSSSSSSEGRPQRSYTPSSSTPSSSGSSGSGSSGGGGGGVRRPGRN